MGIKVYLYCDEVINRDESCIMLMNHIGNLDWMYFYFVVQNILNPYLYRVTLKAALSRIPGAGMFASNLGFVLNFEIYFELRGLSVFIYLDKILPIYL